MLDEEQRRTVLEMFSSGKSISEISREVGISRPSVYRVIASGVEKDPEILKLKKELKKTELRKKIDEVKEPMKIKEPIKTRNKLDRLDIVVHRLISEVLYLRGRHRKEAPRCFYCGERLEYCDIEEPSGIVAQGYRCNRCKRDFVFP